MKSRAVLEQIHNSTNFAITTFPQHYAFNTLLSTDYALKFMVGYSTQGREVVSRSEHLLQIHPWIMLNNECGGCEADPFLSLCIPVADRWAALNLSDSRL